MEDYYALLSIPKKATQDEIKNAYRAKVKQYHPDLFNAESIAVQAEVEKITKMINNAYEILSDTVKKNEYDNTINNQQNKKSQNDSQATKRNKSYQSNDQKQKTSNGNKNTKKNEKQNNTEQNKENEKNDIAIIINNHRYVLFKDFPLYFSLSSHIEEMEKHLIIIKRSHISLDDDLIRTIVKAKPTTKDELSSINGITEDDINRYGDTIINIILEYLEINNEINERK